ncbi:HpcH/HpaI aldolase/citrate lyase family protein [Microbacterium trichothecenolyticum]|uniref:HpcH/HpaI aldolase/citrate lyase family protein n=1 Tax=Microbacterium trichothecenolyticum TaxID=69370 RepID=A0A0M2H9B2_MICTR|nr:HpcH/HpaI aldolase/citrate lyase family protein [Microbacterium trichothecenolyticum]
MPKGSQPHRTLPSRADDGARPLDRAATALRPEELIGIDRLLAAADRLLADDYPGDDDTRQPVHTVYVAADRYAPALPREWGAAARDAVEAHGGMEAVALDLGVPEAFAADVATLVTAKLASEPIEDLRLDLEDGYGDRGDENEDADVRRAAGHLLDALAGGEAPPFFGIRIKGLERATRARGIRSLDLFLSTLLEAGDLPKGVRLTLPKVTTVAQVEAMARLCDRLEQHHGLAARSLRFEMQVETPQIVLAADGTSPLARAIHASDGRVSGLHYGTYDYSAALGIAPAYQSLDHPAADHAKNVMQVAAAQTGVRLADGSTNVLPVGDADAVRAAWRLSARLTRRSLERGFFQGWDLHPAQLVPRFVANALFYREGFAPAAARLRAYVDRVEGGILDEPATARALATFVARGVACGAVTEQELTDAAGLDLAALAALAHPPHTTTEGHP